MCCSQCLRLNEMNLCGRETVGTRVTGATLELGGWGQSMKFLVLLAHACHLPYDYSRPPAAARLLAANTLVFERVPCYPCLVPHPRPRHRDGHLHVISRTCALPHLGARRVHVRRRAPLHQPAHPYVH